MPFSPLTPSSLAVAPTGTGDPALHLRADGISFSFPDRRVLTDVSLVVPAGRPTGLLGENGSGKSTLLRLLAGELAPDGGTASAPGPIGVLHQELPFRAEATPPRRRAAASTSCSPRPRSPTSGTPISARNPCSPG